MFIFIQIWYWLRCMIFFNVPWIARQPRWKRMFFHFVSFIFVLGFIFIVGQVQIFLELPDPAFCFFRFREGTGEVQREISKVINPFIVTVASGIWYLLWLLYFLRDSRNDSAIQVSVYNPLPTYQRPQTLVKKVVATTVAITLLEILFFRFLQIEWSISPGETWNALLHWEITLTNILVLVNFNVFWTRMSQIPFCKCFCDLTHIS